MSLANLLRNDESKVAFNSGERLIKQGQDNDQVFVILSGKLDVIIDGIKVASLQEGDIFGEFALIEKVPANADVIATESGEYVAMDERRFNFASQQTPYFAISMFKCLISKLRAMDAARIDAEK